MADVELGLQPERRGLLRRGVEGACGGPGTASGRVDDFGRHVRARALRWTQVRDARCGGAAAWRANLHGERLLEDVRDDRLAPGLWRRAGGSRARDGAAAGAELAQSLIGEPGRSGGGAERAAG